MYDPYTGFVDVFCINSVYRFRLFYVTFLCDFMQIAIILRKKRAA